MSITENLKKLKNLKLSENELNEMRFSITQKMQNSRVIKPNPVRHIEERFFLFNYFINSLNKKNMLITLMILVALSGGVSAAASNALPGDILYPVKVSVNEEVKSALIISNEAQAKWDMRRAEKRLEEAEKLALEGKLDMEKKDKLNSSFKIHIEKAEKEIDDEDDENKASDLSIRVHQILQERSESLANLGSRSDISEESKIEIRGIGDVVSSFAREYKSKSSLKIKDKEGEDQELEIEVSGKNSEDKKEYSEKRGESDDEDEEEDDNEVEIEGELDIKI